MYDLAKAISRIIIVVRPFTQLLLVILFIRLAFLKFTGTLQKDSVLESRCLILIFYLYLGYLFADQFLFTPGNMYRFDNSPWLPIIEAIFL